MIVGLLLAAGGARRFGSQKLVAPLAGEPLVRHAARALIACTDSAIAVVGNGAAIVESALNDLKIAVVQNPDWSTGLASSLRCGIAALPADAEAVVVMLGDQPQIDPAVIRAVIDTWRHSGRAIVAARYDEVQGHPVLFAREVFDELLALEGDRGAKSVIERIADRLAYLDVAAPAPRDVDTPRDLNLLSD